MRFTASPEFRLIAGVRENCEGLLIGSGRFRLLAVGAGIFRFGVQRGALGKTVSGTIPCSIDTKVFVFTASAPQIDGIRHVV